MIVKTSPINRLQLYLISISTVHSRGQKAAVRRELTRLKISEDQVKRLL